MPMVRVAISQSNYLPWRGFFDLIFSVDVFLLYDTAQYTRRDWRNRNLIKTPSGPAWLTVPVNTKGQYQAPICEIKTQGSEWREKHLRALLHAYSRAAYFSEGIDLVESFLLGMRSESLSEINEAAIRGISDYLGIKTKIHVLREPSQIEGKNERLLEILANYKDPTYVSGPAAKAYLDEDLFRRRGVEVNWFSYGDYEEYKQLWGDFESRVSIIDLIMNCGPQSRQIFNRVKA